MSHPSHIGRWGACALSACLAAALGACSSTSHSASETPSPPSGKPAAAVPVTFMLGNPTLSLGHVQLAAAQEFGYWNAAGVNVKVQFSTGTTSAQADVANGQADMGQSDALALALSAAKGQANFTAVCSYVDDNIYTLVTKQDSPNQDIASLVGKKIGVESLGTGAYQSVLAMFKSIHVPDPATAATFVVIGTPAAQLQALENGTVDALATIDVLLGTYATQGHSFHAISQTGPGQWWWNVIVANNDFMKAHPDAVAGVCKGIQQGELLTKNSPTAALAAYKMDPQGGTAGLGSLTTAKAITVINSRAVPGYRTLPEGNDQWGWMNIPAEQSLADIFSANGVLPKAIKASDLYTNQFVPKMQPDEAAVSADISKYGS